MREKCLGSLQEESRAHLGWGGKPLGSPWQVSAAPLRAAPHPTSGPVVSIKKDRAGGAEEGGEDETVEVKGGGMFFQLPVTRPCG